MKVDGHVEFMGRTTVIHTTAVRTGRHVVDNGDLNPPHHPLLLHPTGGQETTIGGDEASTIFGTAESLLIVDIYDFSLGYLAYNHKWSRISVMWDVH